MSATFERNKTVRIEAFSDGVFAIAMTLLVLGIGVPKTKNLEAGGSLGTTLLTLWPHYLAFATSFITILLQYRYGPLLCLAAFTLSFVSVYLSVGLCLCLAVFFAFKGWPTTHAAERAVS